MGRWFEGTQLGERARLLITAAAAAAAAAEQRFFEDCARSLAWPTG